VTRWLLAVCVLAVAGTPGASAQTLQGRILEELEEQPIETAIVRLLSPDGTVLVTTLASETGDYLIEVPGAGEYQLGAERLGYQSVTSPLLSMSNPDGAYSVDLTMPRDPIPISGITVSAERRSEVMRGLRNAIGRSPSSLRHAPLLRPEIQDRVERGHNLVDLARWLPNAGIQVHHTLDGPCFQLRRRGCMTVYLDGDPILTELIEVVPLDMVESVVVLDRSESVMYPNGGILLYTAGWLR